MPTWRIQNTRDFWFFVYTKTSYMTLTLTLPHFGEKEKTHGGVEEQTQWLKETHAVQRTIESFVSITQIYSVSLSLHLRWSCREKFWNQVVYFASNCLYKTFFSHKVAFCLYVDLHVSSLLLTIYFQEVIFMAALPLSLQFWIANQQGCLSCLLIA